MIKGRAWNSGNDEKVETDFISGKVEVKWAISSSINQSITNITINISNSNSVVLSNLFFTLIIANQFYYY